MIIVKISQLFQMSSSASNTLEAMEISVYTLDKNCRNVASIERKNFILKEFLVFAEAIFQMNF